MNVKYAKECIGQINKICGEASDYYKNHAEETSFLVDTVSLLCDYERLLRRAIDNAELPI